MGLLARSRRLGKWVLEAHWLGRWYSTRAVRFWRYSAGSVVAYLLSGAVFYAAVDWLDLGAVTSSTIAFVAGAIPNWVLNRRWAWRQRLNGDGLAKETTLYIAVTGTSWVLTVGFTKLAALSVDQMHPSDLTRSVLLTASYMFVQALLFVAKYVAYDRWVFTGGRGRRALGVLRTQEVLAGRGAAPGTEPEAL